MLGPKLTQRKEIVPFHKVAAATERVHGILTVQTVPAQLPMAISWLLLVGGKHFPCPQTMDLGETCHWCPMEENTFLPGLNVLNNSHDSTCYHKTAASRAGKGVHSS